MEKEYFSVLMPTYNQAAFIRRAIRSLYRQTFRRWELIIVNDGCTDETEAAIRDYLEDERVTYLKNDSNQGLGCALNRAMEAARGEWIAYLPSDDYYFDNHLESLSRAFRAHPDLVLTYAGIRFDTSDTLYYTGYSESKGLRRGYCLQLVQTAHRRTARRWTERSEWVSEDLHAMFWHKLAADGSFGRTEQVSCYWTSHPAQRHRLVAERYGGGLNKYRSYYQVRTPLRMRVSRYKFVDEEQLYARFRAQPPLCQVPLKILLLGELAYNPERIYALEQAGHQLYGLWVSDPSFCFSTVGPLPFGHVEDIPAERWRERIPEVQPDVIYGLLNFGAVPLAYEVMRAFPRIPFVWHFKESACGTARGASSSTCTPMPPGGCSSTTRCACGSASSFRRAVVRRSSWTATYPRPTTSRTTSRPSCRPATELCTPWWRGGWWASLLPTWLPWPGTTCMCTSTRRTTTRAVRARTSRAALPRPITSTCIPTSRPTAGRGNSPATMPDGSTASTAATTATWRTSLGTT